MPTPRRGVSLLEVLFSIGVVAVGILGVTAAFIVALHQSGRGNVADQAARLGANAVELFHIRGMGAPAMWRPTPGDTISSTPGQAYAIDPLFVAMNFNNPNTSTVNKGIFPYPVRSYPSDPRMQRISLYSGNSSVALMESAQAEDLFIAQDELVFDLPKDALLSPVQKYSVWQDPSTGTVYPMKRQTEGRFSWMATLVPRIDANQQFTDLYTLSIVVFHRRDSSYDMNFANERVVNVRDFTGVGFAGGEVVLDGANADEVEVKSGDWLLIMGNLAANTPFFRWYRVIDSPSDAEENTTTGRWEREVTLQGSDWPSTISPGTVTSPPPAYGTARAALIRHVVGVYERTIRLEKSSLWSW